MEEQKLTEDAKPEKKDVTAALMKYTAEDAAAVGLPSMESMKIMKALAGELAGTPFLPDSFQGNPVSLFAAMLTGKEQGLSPMQSARSFFLVKGRLGQYADSMMAVMKSRGVRFEYLSYTNEQVTIRATRPDGDSMTVTWGKDEEKTASLGGNDNYRKFPRAMYRSRCLAEIFRGLCPDMGGGQIYSREEIADMDSDTGADEQRIEAVKQKEQGAEYFIGLKKETPAEKMDREENEDAQEKEEVALKEEARRVATQATKKTTPKARTEPVKTIEVEVEKPAQSTGTATGTATAREAPADPAEADLKASLNQRVDELKKQLPQAAIKEYVAASLGLQQPPKEAKQWDRPLTALQSLLKTAPEYVDDIKARPRLYGGWQGSAPNALDTATKKWRWDDETYELARLMAGARTNFKDWPDVVQWIEAVGINKQPVATAKQLLKIAAFSPKVYLLTEAAKGKDAMPLVEEFYRVHGPMNSADTASVEESLLIVTEPKSPAGEGGEDAEGLF